MHRARHARMGVKAKLGALIGLAGLAMAGTSGVASANILPQYQAVSDGTAGYYAIGSFWSVGATVTTQPAAGNIGGVGKGGIGTQLCDPNNGFGLQLGEVSNGTTFSVEYATGILSGAAKDACVGNGVLPNPHILNPALTGLAQGDSVMLYTRFWNSHDRVRRWVHRHWVWTRAWQGHVLFQAFDATSGFDVFSKYLTTAADWHLDNAGTGVQQNTTGLSACTPVLAFDALAPVPAPYTIPSPPKVTMVYKGGSGACNDVADFAGVFANGSDIWNSFSAPGLAHWNVIQAITTGGGLKGNAATVAPDDTLTPVSGTGDSMFSVFAGQVLS